MGISPEWALPYCCSCLQGGIKNHLLCVLKHSKTSWALSLGCVAVQAALEPCLEEWVLWGLGLKGETCFTPLLLQGGWVALPSLEKHTGYDWAGTEPVLLLQ